MRINCVPVKYLTDEWLKAEHREIKMLPIALSRSLGSSKGVNFDMLPKHYTMGDGHGKFFYNKLLYIQKRFNELHEEMRVRGFKRSSDKLFNPQYEYPIEVILVNDECGKPLREYSLEENIKFKFGKETIWNDWIPTEEDMKVNIKRLTERIDIKESFYKYFGYDVTTYESCKFMRDNLFGLIHKDCGCILPNESIKSRKCWKCGKFFNRYSIEIFPIHQKITDSYKRSLKDLNCDVLFKQREDLLGWEALLHKCDGSKGFIKSFTYNSRIQCIEAATVWANRNTRRLKNSGYNLGEKENGT